MSMLKYLMYLNTTPDAFGLGLLSIGFHYIWDVSLIISLAVIEAANQVRDYATSDLVTGRIRVHEKGLWMLRPQFSE